MSTTTIDGVTIGWTDTGAGDATLLVHAGVFGAWFEPLAGHLPGRVIRMLRAGYTGGEVPREPIELAAHAAHAAALLDLLGTGPATVVSHSSGCAIALQLAVDRPDLVARLVLSEPPLIDELLDPADLPEVRTTIGPALGAAMAAAARGDIPAAFDTFNTVVCGRGYRAVLTDVLGQEGIARAERDAEFFFTNEVPALGRWTPPDPARISTPALLVQGAASPGPTHRLIARLAAALPDARVTTIAGANHLLPLTHPTELAGAICQPQITDTHVTS
ncbi:alpha/beta hydrolase [Amycolatopsis sp. NBC_01488]|uniref:alpha/beta fold hydrolase n=1 Tax=Amycolatopsis sp. NBC_01488 TaxID=2903563 RepID=UPI002E2BCF60|nr:alpha/beta hydrolase [Amycolatopsis sp. NBC_01488]